MVAKPTTISYLSVLRRPNGRHNVKSPIVKSPKVKNPNVKSPIIKSLFEKRPL